MAQHELQPVAARRHAAVLALEAGALGIEQGFVKIQKAIAYLAETKRGNSHERRPKTLGDPVYGTQGVSRGWTNRARSSRPSASAWTIRSIGPCSHLSDPRASVWPSPPSVSPRVHVPWDALNPA